MKYWKCVESRCSSKFIRRGYLLEHLVSHHKYSRADARSATLTARRENERQLQGYYENVSSDDAILDILSEQHEVNVAKTLEVINDFDIVKLDSFNVNCSENISVGPDNVSVGCEVDVSHVNPNVSDDSHNDVSVSAGNIYNDLNVSFDNVSVDCEVDVSHENINVNSESHDEVSVSPENVSIVCGSENCGIQDDFQENSDTGSVDSNVSFSYKNVNTSSDVEIIEIYDSDYQLERRTLRPEVEIWCRTGFRYTTYRDNKALFTTVRYEDDYHKYEMKQKV